MRRTRGDRMILAAAACAAAAVAVGCGAGSATPATVMALSSTTPTAGYPFAAVPTTGGEVLVTLTSDGSPSSVSGVQVMQSRAGQLVPGCTEALFPGVLFLGPGAEDLSLSPDGRDAAVAAGAAGVEFYSVAGLVGCKAPGADVAQGDGGTDPGSIGAVLTPDGRYAFVANEYGIPPGATVEGNVGVVTLQRDTTGAITTGSTLLWQIPTGTVVAGLTLSPDASRLYVLAEVAPAGVPGAGNGDPILGRNSCVQQAGSAPSANGLLYVIDVAAAEAGPGSGAILSVVAAGCSPVRAVETSDGSTLWVTARGDDRVLAFSTARLESAPGNALVGYGSSGGTAPVGLRLFQGERYLAVANSNRFGTGTANLAVIDVAVPSVPTVTQTLATGLFPREVNVAGDDATLYLTNYRSETVQVFKPAAP